MRKRSPGGYFIPAFLLICGVFFADQYVKWLVMTSILHADQTSVPAFSDWLLTRHELAYFKVDREMFKSLTLAPWLNFIMVWNQGISFGLFDTNSPHMSLVFVALSAGIALVLLLWLALSASPLVSFALALIIGGALGNIADRLRFSAVVDFIDAHLGDLHWPAFNFADSCIVLGAFLLVLHGMFDGKRERWK